MLLLDRRTLPYRLVEQGADSPRETRQILCCVGSSAARRRLFRRRRTNRPRSGGYRRTTRDDDAIVTGKIEVGRFRNVRACAAVRLVIDSSLVRSLQRPFFFVDGLPGEALRLALLAPFDCAQGEQGIRLGEWLAFLSNGLP